MGEPRLPNLYVPFHDGTTLVRLYPRGTDFQGMYDVEPVLEIWRDPDGNVIDRPDPEKYPLERPPRFPEYTEEMKRESEELGRKWVESGKAAEHQRRRSEERREGLGMTEEQYARYSEARRLYTEALFRPGPVRPPRPEDFGGRASGQRGDG